VKPSGLRSIQHKLFLGVLLNSVVTLLIAGNALFYYDLRSYRTTAVNELRVQAQLIAHATAAALQFDDPKFAADNLALLKARPAIRVAVIYNARGAPFATYFRGAAKGEFPALPEADGVNVEDERIVAFLRVIQNGEIVGTVYLESDFEIYKRIESYLAIAFAAGTVAILVSLLLAAFLQRGITRPIVETADLARRVMETRDYSLRAHKSSQDETGTLVDSFNDMLSEIERRAAALETSRREVQQLNEELEARVARRTAQLEETNRQLEAFSYSVSHDLRAPLRAIDGFGQALVEDYADKADEGMRRYLDRIRAATLRMSQLIEDLLALAQISRAQISPKDVDLSEMARQVFSELASRDPDRKVEIVVWDGIVARADPRLIRIVLENLLGNAWKFTSKNPGARIEFGVLRDAGKATFHVHDNGAGFDMAYANKLFTAFQRLHAAKEFPGTGIGLATVQRIIVKHGGRLWAHSAPGQGATFYFTLEETEGAQSAPAAQPVRETA
jgi:signal transduction histidine kinase